MSDKQSVEKINTKPLKVGGQAVIEGVMMRSPHTVATAVRRSDGKIEVQKFPFVTLSKRHKILNAPVIRGAVNLGEALYLGIKTLNWSAAIAAEDEKGEKQAKADKPIWNKFIFVLSLLISFAAAIGIFMYIPYLIAGIVKGDPSGNQILFHAIAGLTRIGLFLLYLYLISLWKDVRRIFEYHGAEHKSIFAYESTGEAVLASAADKTRFHPRCGTSFLFITATVIILLFAIIDSILIPIIGEYKNPLHRLLIHLPFIPFVAGLSYEVLKLSGEKAKNRFWAMMTKPGLWLQHITTQEPDNTQLEVAITALNASLKEDGTDPEH